MQSKRNIFIFIIIAVVVSGGGILVYKGITKSTMGLIVAGDYVSSDTIVTNLSSEDRDLVMSSLHILSEREDPSGREKAYKLLQSEDNYIWFNACQYLAELGDTNSVPYLIKGLDHPAWRSHNQVADYLKTLTGKSFGKDQEKWVQWWENKCPESRFSFEYPKIREKTLSLSSRDKTLITAVIDPLRIRRGDAKIRLIGISLKENIDKQKAVSLLEQALVNQWVRLEFDKGAKLDEEGARRALVYWVGKGEADMDYLLRRNLPPVPFTSKTLVNSYLLKSDCYRLDSNSVNDPEIVSLLENATN